MGDELRFDGKVVVITGAGQGLGRSHALLFAKRGAKVVVNDLGGSHTGSGKSSAAADKVVAEIKELGGTAVPNYDSVEDGDKIIKTAVDAFGRVDVVVNNAGILRDVTFHKMTREDWDLIYKVHVLGAFRVTHAAWPLMRDQGYGRVVFTASAAGLYGNFGQANYAMAKLGLVGLAQTLALEGEKKNIRVNAIAPIAGSRMTETILPKDLLDALKPEYVSPLVAWLCHEECPENGGVFEVGGGLYTKLRWERTEGRLFKLGRDIAPEAVRGAWESITDFKKSTHPKTVTESLAPVLSNTQSKSLGGNELIDVDQALGYQWPTLESSYDERDMSLYALGVGAGSNPTDENDLHLTYERNSDGFWTLPTYGVIPAINTILQNALEGNAAPGMNYGLDRILHGEQYTEVMRPLPPKAQLKHKARIAEIWDKGKHALVVTHVDTFDGETGELLVKNDISMMIRGAGGWGGERGPASDVNVAPERKPDAVVTEKTSQSQALLYRLSGDWNPLHIDPQFAGMFGFEKPILHGLCTFGYVGRAVVNSFLGGDPRKFKSIKVRFADSVFPGETIKTEMWKESEHRVLVRATVVERNKVVVSNAAVELYAEIPQPRQPEAPKPAAAAAAAAVEPAGVTSGQIFGAIGAYVAATPELKKIATVYQFKLKNPESAWVIDLKEGKVAAGTAKADTTLELTDADWLDMAQGKADPQKLFSSGKLKISGNIMASQKLTFLQKIDKQAAAAALAPAAAPAAAPSAPYAPSAQKVFAALNERLQKSPALGKEIDATITFKVKNPDATTTVDLGKGSAATLTISDEDLTAIAKGEATVKDLYTRGQLRVDGDVKVAHRLNILNKLL